MTIEQGEMKNNEHRRSIVLTITQKNWLCVSRERKNIKSCTVINIETIIEMNLNISFRVAKTRRIHIRFIVANWQCTVMDKIVTGWLLKVLPCLNR